MRAISDFLLLANGLFKALLVLVGLVVIALVGIILVDRNMPGRVRDLMATSHPAWMEWVEGPGEFARGTRNNVEVTSGESGGLTLHPGATQGFYVSPTYIYPDDWNALGVEWRSRLSTGTRVQVHVHSSPDGRNWSDWEEILVDDDLSAEGATYGRLIMTNPARYLQYRVTLAADTPLVAPFVHRLRLVAMNTRQVRAAQPTATPRAAASTGGTLGMNVPASPFKIISRAAWGADESLLTRVPEYQKPAKIVIHHTGTIPRVGEPAAAIRALYLYHDLTRGWGDLAYNYVVDPQGNIYEGRAGGDMVVGPHARQYSYGSIGIGLLGNYEHEPMPDAMSRSLVGLVTFLCDHYGIDPRGVSNFYDLTNAPNIMLARDLGPTVYPGQFLASALPLLRDQAWEQVRSLPPQIVQYGATPDRPVSGKKAIIVAGEGLLTAQVDFYLDDQLAQSVKQPSAGNQFVWDWDTARSPDGAHVVKVVARGTNKSDAILQTTYVVDNSGPKGQVVINDGLQYTAAPTLTLTITATDISGVASMQFVDLNGAPLADPEPLAARRTVVLRPGEGPRMVALRFTDALGNRSPIVNASIFLDTLPPEDWREFNGAAYPLNIKVTDKGSGVNLAIAKYSTSDDGAQWSDWQLAQGEWDGKTQTARIAVTGGVSRPWIRFYAEDFAGNGAASPAFTVSAPPSTETPVPVSKTPAAAGSKPVAGITPGARGTPTATSAAAAVPRPDFKIDSVEIYPPQAEAGANTSLVVTIRNQGAATKKGFWVGLWIDPDLPPGVNAADPSRDNLVMWYVLGLGANEITALTSNSPYQLYTTYPGRLAAGPHRLYALVDAVNPEGKGGLVAEADEDNNLQGPITIDVQGSEPAWAGTAEFLKSMLKGWGLGR